MPHSKYCIEVYSVLIYGLGLFEVGRGGARVGCLMVSVGMAGEVECEELEGVGFGSRRGFLRGGGGVGGVGSPNLRCSLCRLVHYRGGGEGGEGGGGVICR